MPSPAGSHRRRTTMDASDGRGAGCGRHESRGHCRRHRLCRSGTRPPAGPPSPCDPDDGDVRRRPRARPAACRRSRASGMATCCPSIAGARCRRADIVFLALPEAASAEFAPIARGRRSRGRPVGSVPLRDDAARARLYPATGAMPDGVVYGLTEFEPSASRPRVWCRCPGCYPTASLLALLPLARRRPADAGRRRHHRREVRHLRRRQVAVRPHALLREPRERGGLRHLLASAQPEMEQALGQRVTFVPASRAARSRDPSSVYVRLVPGTTAAQVNEALQRAYASAPFVRLTGEALPEIKHVAHTNFCDIGWKVDEANGRVVRGVGHRQPGEGRGRTGRAELEPDARARRADGPAVTGRPVSEARR